MALQPLEQNLADAQAQLRSLQEEVSRLREESSKAHAETAKLQANQQAAALQLQVLSFPRYLLSCTNLISQNCDAANPKKGR
jgi:chromosome segregation ATPase